ncbi:hypothetical protein, partial [Microbispora corallina]|uniref:hypothetical protein n=1 Tax=Microbispora corallina TaxID=83302 RepID=UPI0031D284C9
ELAAAAPAAAALVASGAGTTSGHAGSPGRSLAAATPSAAAVGGARLLGAPDWDGYCRATGQGTARLTGADAYGWRCAGQNATGNGAAAVCAWTYHSAQVADRVADFFDPRSWQCWHATRRLGALDFSAYCRARGRTGARYVSGRGAYGWYCAGETFGIDTQAACRWQYGADPPVSRFQDFYDKDSWQCWG